MKIISVFDLSSDCLMNASNKLIDPVTTLFKTGFWPQEKFLLFYNCALPVNFRAGSTFPVPVSTVPHGHWVNKADTQQD